jgi:UDP-2,3-diacylglucosamine hydrolase
LNGRSIFVADCHISGRDCARIKAVSDFFEEISGANGLYILGDLFEVWTGPALLSDAALKPVFESLKKLSAAGTEIFFLRGNRDFLLGETEKRAFGFKFVGDSFQVDLPGARALLAHGDIFCAHDSHYQGYRRFIRSRPMRVVAKVMPPALGRKIADGMRRRSEEIVRRKGPRMTNLVQSKLVETFMKTGADAIVCGHVHRREVLHVPVSGKKKPVYVLGAWEHGRCALEYNRGKFNWLE